MSRPRLTFKNLKLRTIDNNDMDAEKYEGIDFSALFAAGVAGVAISHGMSEKDAESFTMDICKEAAGKRIRWEEDEDEDTFWNRNKKWLIPTIVGSLAYYIGADGERHGRRDRGFLANSGNRIWERTKILLGMDDNNAVSNMLKKHPEKLPAAVVGNQETGE